MERKPTRLGYYDYSTPGAYFVTICTQNKKCILSTIVGDGSPVPSFHTVLTRSGKIVQDHILEIPQKYPTVRVDHYVIMPNHIHLLLSFGENPERFGTGDPSPTAGDVERFGTGDPSPTTGDVERFGTGDPSPTAGDVERFGTGDPSPTAGDVECSGTGDPSPTARDVECFGTGDPSPTLGNVIGWLKYQITKQVNLYRGTAGIKIFQRSYHDHIIRNERDYQRIWTYIDGNPARWRDDCFYTEHPQEEHP